MKTFKFCFYLPSALLCICLRALADRIHDAAFIVIDMADNYILSVQSLINPPKIPLFGRNPPINPAIINTISALANSAILAALAFLVWKLASKWGLL